MVLDRGLGLPVLMASAEGGVDIEEVAAKHPEKILKVPVDPDAGPAAVPGPRAGLSSSASPATRPPRPRRSCSPWRRCSFDKDASLAEINPLVVTKKGEVLALDAKFDLRRQRPVPPQRRRRRCATRREENPAEVRAGKADLNYISLDGNIGCLVNGAGLAMATMDIIKYHGGEPANFLDVGGGVTAEGAIEAFRIILSDPKVKGVLVNIFGGIAKCDLIAEALVKAGRGGRLQGAGGGAAGGDERRQGPGDPEGRPGRAADDADGHRPDRRGEEGGRGGEVTRRRLMRRDDILRRLQEHPFRPFHVRLGNWTIHLIQHPELAMVGGSSIVIGIPRSGLGPGDIDDYMVVSLAVVADTDPENHPAHATSRRRRPGVTLTRTEADMATVSTPKMTAEEFYAWAEPPGERRPDVRTGPRGGRRSAAAQKRSRVPQLGRDQTAHGIRHPSGQRVSVDERYWHRGRAESRHPSRHGRHALPPPAGAGGPAADLRSGRPAGHPDR